MSCEVRACGSVEELRAALAPIFHFFGRSPTRADALFATDRAPWCPEIF